MGSSFCNINNRVKKTAEHVSNMVAWQCELNKGTNAAEAL